MKIVREYDTKYKAQILRVSAAKYIGNFKIAVEFSDGTSQTVNFAPFLKKKTHPAITKYQDENTFKNFQLVNGNINWNDYDMIFPIEDLYKGKIG